MKLNYRYLYNCDETREYIEHTEKCYYDKSPARVEVYDDGIILPWQYSNDSWGKGGVVDSNGKFVESSRKAPICDVSSFFGGYYEFEITRSTDEEIIYLGYFKEHWGHFLVDCLARIWYPLQNSGIKIGYLINDKDKFSNLYEETFELLGIKRELVCLIKEPTQFKRVIVPEESYSPMFYWKKEFKDTFDLLKKNANAKCSNNTKYEKIYLSKQKWKLGRQKGEFGEREIQKTFENNGFHVIYPELLNASEKIYIISNAEEIVTAQGTSAHMSALFSNKSTRIVILNKYWKHIPHQYICNEISNNVVICVDVYFKRTPGVYLIGFNENLNRYVLDNNIKCTYNQMQLLLIHFYNSVLYYKKLVCIPFYKLLAYIRNKIKGE